MPLITEEHVQAVVDRDRMTPEPSSGRAAIRNSQSQFAHIQRLVTAGRITPEQGARLLELRREIAWRRLPWWRRAIAVLARAVSR